MNQTRGKILFGQMIRIHVGTSGAFTIISAAILVQQFENLFHSNNIFMHRLTPNTSVFRTSTDCMSVSTQPEYTGKLLYVHPSYIQSYRKHRLFKQLPTYKKVPIALS